MSGEKLCAHCDANIKSRIDTLPPPTRRIRTPHRGKLPAVVLACRRVAGAATGIRPDASPLDAPPETIKPAAALKVLGERASRCLPRRPTWSTGSGPARHRCRQGVAKCRTARDAGAPGCVPSCLPSWPSGALMAVPTPSGLERAACRLRLESRSGPDAELIVNLARTPARPCRRHKSYPQCHARRRFQVATHLFSDTGQMAVGRNYVIQTRSESDPGPPIAASVFASPGLKRLGPAADEWEDRRPAPARRASEPVTAGRGGQTCSCAWNLRRRSSEARPHPASTIAGDVQRQSVRAARKDAHQRHARSCWPKPAPVWARRWAISHRGLTWWASAQQAGTVWISTYTKNLQRQLEQETARLVPDPAERRHRIVVRKGRENYVCLLNMQDWRLRA